MFTYAQTSGKRKQPDPEELLPADSAIKKQLMGKRTTQAGKKNGASDRVRLNLPPPATPLKPTLVNSPTVLKRHKVAAMRC